MIGVDISNVWCRVSLPEVLGREKEIFEAHSALAGDNDHGWLTRRIQTEEILTAADRLRQNARTLVVVGVGRAVLGVRGVVRLTTGRRATTPRLLFVGDNVSAADWEDVLTALEQTEFSVLATAPTGNEPEPLIALRALRWVMEKRYGDDRKNRVVISAPAGSDLARLAETEDYLFLPAQTLPGGADSVLGAGALTLLAAVGHSPELLLRGGTEQYEICDVRSLENPGWLYAAARYALSQKGRNRELLCLPNEAEGLGQWWSRTVSGGGIWTSALRLPADLHTVGDALLDGRQNQFVTALRLPGSGRMTTVETAWKNPDRLESLAGRSLDSVEAVMLDAAARAVGQADVPLISVECDEDLTDDKIGQLLYFVEFAAGLQEKLAGGQASPLRGLLGDIDRELGRNSWKP